MYYQNSVPIIFTRETGEESEIQPAGRKHCQKGVPIQGVFKMFGGLGNHEVLFIYKTFFDCQPLFCKSQYQQLFTH